MSTPKKAILITGATGKQGGATIDALIEAGALESHTLLALTRNKQSNSAKKLEARGVKIVQGNLNDTPSVFANAKAILSPEGDVKVWGVFSVQVAIGRGVTPKSEEAQGKALIDAGLANGVEFFVYTSVDRGGEERSAENPTNVPQFIPKYNIEKHLLAATSSTSEVAPEGARRLQWTILRPAAFMDSFTPGFGTKLFATLWRVGLPDKPLQLVAVKDIGWFAAQAFLRPAEFAGRSISLAGDELTLAEANGVFKRKVGYDMPEMFHFLVRLILWLYPILGNLWRFLRDEGYHADIPALRAEYPGLLSFEAWLEKESEWRKKFA
ncbi:NAD(P)-binding protein [Xylariaceae sp. FL0662B]|nr:NAD(P)-binding protein [Xylariaceae sp. FL0662B]